MESAMRCNVSETRSTKMPKGLDLEISHHHNNCKVHLNMSTYVHPAPSAEARPVALGIKDTKFYLSCHKVGDQTTLHLETVEDKKSLKSISSGSDMERLICFFFPKYIFLGFFAFNGQDTGVNISTLMSASFPNWYISTAGQDNKPLEMCLQTANRYRTFNIQRQS